MSEEITTERPTREQILAEPAGYNLDCLVAELVMGWLRITDDEPFSRHVSRGGVITSEGPMIFDIPGSVIPTAWHPSRRIADAWQVVENSWISKRYYWSEDWSLQRADWMSGDGKCCRVIHHPSGRVIAESDNPALTLCRAALLAVLS